MDYAALHPAPEEFAPIHRAAWEGDVEAVTRLVEADGRLVNALTPDSVRDFRRQTPLMLATRKELDAVVERLLALGADPELRDDVGYAPLHRACVFKLFGIAGRLLDAGANFNAYSGDGTTPLMCAARSGSLECLRLLLARSGDALDLDAQTGWGKTALHHAVDENTPEAVRLLLEAGADFTLRERPHNRTPLNLANIDRSWKAECYRLLRAATDEPLRPRTLLRVRELSGAADAVGKARSNARTRAGKGCAAVAAAPVYLKRCVKRGRPLPQVGVRAAAAAAGPADEHLVACVKYALGLEGGGGWHEGDGPAPEEGMVKEVFVELCEMMVPKRARTNM